MLLLPTATPSAGQLMTLLAAMPLTTLPPPPRRLGAAGGSANTLPAPATLRLPVCSGGGKVVKR